MHRACSSFDDVRRLNSVDSELELPDGLLQLLDSDRPEEPLERPWVSTNMVMSLDGGFARDGRSAGLSSDADRSLFGAQRSLADVILVGASTVRKEHYGHPKLVQGAAEIRRERGQEALPRIATVTRSVSFDADIPLFDGEPPAPLIFHPGNADTSTAPRGAELLACGEGGVDLVTLLDVLHERGARRVVCEGGPGLLGQLAADDRIDEYLLTLAPLLVGGTDVGLLARSKPAGAHFRLHRVLRDRDHLMLCYRRH